MYLRFCAFCCELLPYPILVPSRYIPNLCIASRAPVVVHCFVPRTARRTCRPAMFCSVPLVSLVYRYLGFHGLSIPTVRVSPSIILSGLRMLRQISIEFVMRFGIASLKKPSLWSTRVPILMSNVSQLISTVVSQFSYLRVMEVPMPGRVWQTFHPYLSVATRVHRDWCSSRDLPHFWKGLPGSRSYPLEYGAWGWLAHGVQSSCCVVQIIFACRASVSPVIRLQWG